MKNLIIAPDTTIVGKTEHTFDNILIVLPDGRALDIESAVTLLVRHLPKVQSVGGRLGSSLKKKVHGVWQAVSIHNPKEKSDPSPQPSESSAGAPPYHSSPAT